MRRPPLLVGLALLADCGQPAPTLNALEREAQMAHQTARVHWSMDPCMLDDGVVISSRPLRDCVDLLPQERMHGVWYSGLEFSEFVRNATSAPPIRTLRLNAPAADRPAYLEMDRETAMRIPTIPPPYWAQNYAWLIDFVGRRSKHPGGYAMSGEDEDLVVVDRLISVRLLGPALTRLDAPGCTGDCAEPR